MQIKYGIQVMIIHIKKLAPYYNLKKKKKKKRKPPHKPVGLHGGAAESRSRSAAFVINKKIRHTIIENAC